MIDGSLKDVKEIGRDWPWQSLSTCQYQQDDNLVSLAETNQIVIFFIPD